MNIGLIDVDSKIPNLALMKISAWHKAQGDSVEWYGGLFDNPDRIYASKVFTFTPDYQYFPSGGAFPYLRVESATICAPIVNTELLFALSLLTTCALTTHCILTWTILWGF